MRNFNTDTTLEQSLIGDGGIDPTDPTEPTLVSKTFFINQGGLPVMVVRQFEAVTGSAVADFRIGTGSAEYFDLGGGNDTAYGGGGDDLMEGGAGHDKLYGDAGNDDLRGGEGMDSLYGGIGDDVLNGGSELDLLVGGAGNDLYRVYGQMDTIVENAGEGIDTIYTNVKFVTLPAHVDRLVADSSMLTSGVVFTGNAIDNTLIGSVFNDTLDGGAGADQMRGGAGNDHYRVDHLMDQVVEQDGSAAGGVDSVLSAIPYYTMTGGVENLAFNLPAGTGATGIGNAWDNKITGTASADALYGYGGDDVLAGGEGADKLFGGLGNDIYMADAADQIEETWNGGYDRVYTNAASFALAPYVEELQFNIVVSGSQVLGPLHFTGLGNAQANKITGNIGHDTLRGGDGKDALDGDQGNDMLFGDAGDDYLAGGAGNDQLIGDIGNDTMAGGIGDDYYAVDSLGDLVMENAGAGVDGIGASLADYTLPANVEHLWIASKPGQQGSATGNELDNILTGSHGNDLIQGGAGHDVLVGANGNDTLVGGSGNDDFVINGLAAGHDVFLDFTPGSDRIIVGLDADPSTLGNDPFVYVAGGSFAGNGVASLRAELIANGVQLQLDTNGDMVADAFVDLVGLAALPAANDFVGVIG